MATFVEEFTRMRDDCDRAHQDRLQCFQEMRNDAQRIKDETHALVDDFHTSHAEMAQRLRSGLAEFAGDVRTGAHTLLDAFCATRTEMAEQLSMNAKQLRNGLAEFANDFRTGGRIFRGFSAAPQQPAGSQTTRSRTERSSQQATKAKAKTKTSKRK